MKTLAHPEIDRRVKTAVSIVARSANSKLGPVSATYAPQSTCPDACPLRGAGCYAESGALRFTTGQRNDVATAAAMTVAETAAIEAAGIDSLAAGKRPLDLRVHVVGDCPTDAAAELVGAAMVRYETVTGKRAWTYTHAWRSVDVRSWGGAHVLASCESMADVAAAGERGYQAVIVVGEHPADGRARREDGRKIVPCPNQTRGVQCKDCGLCATGGIGGQNAVIAFAAHGKESARVRETLS